jgi:hypothetical protein
MICLQNRKLQLFSGQFKKYKFSNDEIKNICSNSGGLLGSRVGNFVGLFDTLRYYGITSKDVKKILSLLPTFALQNRKDMIRLKIEVLAYQSGRDRIYMRNFVKRHPDIMIKSMSSLEAKISYLSRNLNR